MGEWGDCMLDIGSHTTRVRSTGDSARRPTLSTVRIDRQGEPFYVIADGYYPDGNDKKTAFPLTLMRQGERTLLILKKSAL
jgi:hypothetical protein